MKALLVTATLTALIAGSVAARCQTPVTIQYGPLATQLLDLCQAPLPNSGVAVVLIHGGGWVGGNREQFDDMCQYLAAHSITAVTIDYRPDNVPANQWPAQLADAQLAMRWMRANAATYGVNPLTVCSWGNSAGAQLSLMLSTLSYTEDTDMSGYLNQYSSQATCSVDVSPASNLTELWADDKDLAMLKELTGGNAALLADASTAPRTTTASTPALIVAGINDPTFPFAQQQGEAEALAANGVGVTFLPNDGGHVESGLTPAQKELINEEEMAFLLSFKPPS